MAKSSSRTRFEEDYLERTYGTIVRNPAVALTELVANAWDAGASQVSIRVPDEDGEGLVVEDDGIGMRRGEFKSRWMTLGYNRKKNQGVEVAFPDDRSGGRRKAFGRNGVGRHALFCFGNEYEVVTRKNGRVFSAAITKAHKLGMDPFSLSREKEGDGEGHGTTLSVRVQRNRPSPDKIRETLSCRFVSDPSFTIIVNGEKVLADDTSGFINGKSIILPCGVKLALMTYDSGSTGRTMRQSGIAFWVGGRLVGNAKWAVGDRTILDGRRKQAKRLVIVAKSDDLFDEVEADWTGFRLGEKVEQAYEAVADYAEEVLREHLREHVQETTEEVIRSHADRLRSLDAPQRYEVAEFVEQVRRASPALPSEVLDTAMSAFVGLLESKSGRDLLQKLSTFSSDDKEALNSILEQWSVQDCQVVLDEIGRRMSMVEAIHKIMGDPATDELRGLHPLVTLARWLFGPDFESSSYTSNVAITTALSAILGRDVPADAFCNPKRRPDLLILPNRTFGITATESFDPSEEISKVEKILLIELKKGNAAIGRNEMNQASGYIADLLTSGTISTKTSIHAFVVGHRIADHTIVERNEGSDGLARIRAITYSQLVATADRRLVGLRQRVSDRHEGLAGNNLVEKVLSQTGHQNTLFDGDLVRQPAHSD